MAEEKPKIPGKFIQPLIARLLKITVPLLNHPRIPKKWLPIGSIKSFEEKGNRLLFKCDNGFLEIKIITKAIWRVRASRTPLPKTHESWATVEPKNNFKLQVKRVGDHFNISEKRKGSSPRELQMVINQKDSTITFLRTSGDIIHHEIKSISWSKKGSWVQCQKLSPAREKHVGFGERTGKLVKNGKKLIFWNTDPTAYGLKDDPLYQSEPIQMSIREDGTAHGIFYDNQHYSVIKISKHEQGKTDYYSEREPICYYVFCGPTVKDVSRQIAELNGKLPFPPRWVLGNHQSRWSYSPEEKVREIANNFRSRNIPCDCIHLDIDYMNGYRCFTWSRERFPDPKGLIEDLRKEGFKVISIVDPALKLDPEWDIYQECIENDYHCKLPNSKPYIDSVWPGKCIFPDFTKPDTRKWWGTKFKSLFDVGLEGIWLDMGEPSTFTARRTAPAKVQHDMNGNGGDHRDAHNIYGQAMAMATREGIDAVRGKLRTFIFVRSCYAGIQRWAASWTGDNYSNWIGLQQSIPMILNMGLTGQVFVAADLGGFERDCTPELLARWYQLGVFYPFCRNHSAYGTRVQEPWAFGEEIEKIVREYLELRYQLIPYFYYYLWEACQTGLPMMRPLFMEAPHDPNTLKDEWVNSEFFVGESILVAPILQKGSSLEQGIEREVYFPKGQWIDYWTKERFKGGRTITVKAKLDHLPLYVKAGSVIPLGPIVPHLERTEDYPLFLEVFSGEKLTGKAYLDDGQTKDFQQGIYNLLTITGEQREEQITLEIVSEGKMKDLPTTNKSLIIKFYDKRMPKVISVNSKAVSKGEEQDRSMFWTKEEHEAIIEIHCKKPKFPLKIVVDF